MFEKIREYVGSLLPMFKRDRVTEDARVLRGNLEQFALPAYKVAMENFASLKIKSKHIQDKYDDFNEIVKKVPGKNVVEKIFLSLQYIQDNLGVIERQIDKKLETNIATAGTSAASATIIRSLEVMTFTVNYSLLFLNWLYWEETNAQGGQSHLGSLSNGEVKFINDKFPSFCRAVNIYVENHSKFEQLIKNIPDITVGSEVAEGALAVFDASQVDPMNYAVLDVYKIENPIYHIRLIVAEFQNQVYTRNKELKMALEMRALRLQQVLDKEPNAQVEKELEYVQSRVEDLNAKIRDYEKKVA